MSSDDAKHAWDWLDDRPEPEVCGYCGAEIPRMNGDEDLEEIPVCPQCYLLFLAKRCFSREQNGACAADQMDPKRCAVCHEKVRDQPHDPDFFRIPPDIFGD